MSIFDTIHINLLTLIIPNFDEKVKKLFCSQPEISPGAEGTDPAWAGGRTGTNPFQTQCPGIRADKGPFPGGLSGHFQFFGISIDSLIRVDLRTLGELKLRELEAGNDVYMRGGNLRVLAISVDKGNQENVEYVPIKAKAGYLSGYNDPEFIASLPRFSLPNLPRQGTYRIFPTVGDSMLPIPGEATSSPGIRMTGQP